MNQWKNLATLGVAFLFFAGWSAWGQSLPGPDVLDARARTADPRLNTSVNVDVDRMYLGELLEKISAQTDVSVSMPANDPFSGIPITCHVKNLPLADFMNSLWSLVGYTKATWKITIDSQRKPLRYVLLPTPDAHALPARLNAETEKATTKLWDLDTKISKLTPRERQAYIHPLSEAMLMETDEWAKMFLQDSPMTNDAWARFSMVETELTPAQQEQLQQGIGIAIPLSHLTPAHQDLMRAFVHHTYIEKDGVRTELPPPDKVTFILSRSLGGTQVLMRDLYMDVGTGEGFGGVGFMGAMSLGLKRILAEKWILPGDAKSSGKESSIINSLPKFPIGSAWENVSGLDLVLTQVAAAQDVSYIAIVPDGGGATFSVLGKTLEQCFADFRRGAGLIHKWRNNVLLLNYETWFYGDDGASPYDVVKQLRETYKLRRDDQQMVIPVIADGVVALTDAQAKRLANEFPEVAASVRLRPIFLLYKKYPEILMVDGRAVDLNMLTMMTQMKLLPAGVHNDEIERIRISEDPTTAQLHNYRLQYRPLHQKEWTDLGRFKIRTYPSRVNPSS